MLQDVLDARTKASFSEIIENQLWLGSGSAASSLDILQSLEITKILNVADDVPNYFESHTDCFEYFNLNVADFGSDKGISRVFESAFTKLLEWQSSSEKVFVHCAAGVNRSATVVIAWLMYSRRLSLFKAWEFVSERRKVCPLKDNRRELLMYEKEIFSESSYPDDDAFLYAR
jgi:protein-tyrosine phosphatase